MKPSILVVDDDDNIREVIHAVLTQAGFQVLVAASGEAALALLKRSRFELVLLDVHMPKMSGLEVLAAMKKIADATPVLMVTADSQTATVREALSLGCSGYIAKPFTPATLVERVRRVLPQPENTRLV
ncbi:response regulator [Brevundimonas sp. AJA228-03]|uniref:response regulator transcription factor n=1 Tax=Brevundimonas sp. AJA228-03 TaxID=2752515 RepID=UPI001AE03730|nr:response regulator [Brevundimonas sp. AJA228-03]QTN19173.1 response regulator [Brevundimonas sp. AJA228-03]